MPGRYIVRVVTDFSAAHVIHGYDGPCNRMHGHNWRVEVEAELTQLDDIGLSLDFRVLRGATQEIAQTMDHRVLNELPMFEGRNPTAEHVAAVFATALLGRIPALSGDRARLRAVTIWENDRSAVRYEPG